MMTTKIFNHKENFMTQEKINLSIETPMTGFDTLALRRFWHELLHELSFTVVHNLVAAHVGLSFTKTPEDAGYEMCRGHISPRPALAGPRFDLGERAPDEAQECTRLVSSLCEIAKTGQTALYCRTATFNPAVIAAQRDALEDFAKKRGFSDLAYYEDDGYSGRNSKRPAFVRLEEDIRAGKIARVMVASVTRLGRNTAEVIRWAIWLRQHGAEIITLDPPVDINAALGVLESA